MSRIAAAARAATPRPVAGERGPAPLAIDVEARNAAIDHGQLAADRLARFRAELVRRDYGAAVLSDPINIRYVTGARNMAVWTMHAPGRYVFVPVDGPVVLFEYASSKHLSEGLDTIDEIRHSVSPFYFLAGPRTAEMAERWSRDIVALDPRPRRTRSPPCRRPVRAMAGAAPVRRRASRCSTPRSRPRSRA